MVHFPEVPMRITIRTAPGVKPGLADVAKRRLEFALGRFGPRIRRLTVRLDELRRPSAAPHGS
jgi:hypothetical protein